MEMDGLIGLAALIWRRAESGTAGDRGRAYRS